MPRVCAAYSAGVLGRRGFGRLVCAGLALGLVVLGWVALGWVGVRPAGAAVPNASWTVVRTSCVNGVVNLEVRITAAVVGQSYAIYDTSGLLTTSRQVTATASTFTATFTPNEAYGANDNQHYSVTGDVEAPAIGQMSQVRTIVATCAASGTPPPPVGLPTTTPAPLPPTQTVFTLHQSSSHTGRDLLIVAIALIVVAGAVELWRRRRRHRRRRPYLRP